MGGEKCTVEEEGVGGNVVGAEGVYVKGQGD